MLLLIRMIMKNMEGARAKGQHTAKVPLKLFVQIIYLLPNYTYKIHLWEPLAHIKKTICLYLSQWRGLSKSQVPAYFQKLLYKTFQGLDCLFEAEIRFCTLRLTAMHINLRQQLKQYMVNVSLSIQIENCKKCSIIGECLKLIERKKAFLNCPRGLAIEVAQTNSRNNRKYAANIVLQELTSTSYFHQKESEQILLLYRSMK